MRQPIPSTVAYVGSSAFAGNSTTPNVTLPANVSDGDRLVMVLSLAASDRVLSGPTGVTGWTVLGTSIEHRDGHDDLHQARRARRTPAPR